MMASLKVTQQLVRRGGEAAVALHTPVRRQTVIIYQGTLIMNEVAVSLMQAAGPK